MAIACSVVDDKLRYMETKISFCFRPFKLLFPNLAVSDTVNNHLFLTGYLSFLLIFLCVCFTDCVFF